MTNATSILALALALGLSAGPVLAADNPAPAAQNTQASGTASPDQMAKVEPKATWFDDLYASDLTDKDLVDASGEEIADIANIVKQRNDGKLFAVVSMGGFMGLGDRKIAVPLDELKRDAMSEDITLANKTIVELKAMPDYDESAYETVSDYQKLQYLKKG